MVASFVGVLHWSHHLYGKDCMGHGLHSSVSQAVHFLLLLVWSVQCVGAAWGVRREWGSPSLSMCGVCCVDVCLILCQLST